MFYLSKNPNIIYVKVHRKPTKPACLLMGFLMDHLFKKGKILKTIVNHNHIICLNEHYFQGEIKFQGVNI